MIGEPKDKRTSVVRSAQRTVADRAQLGLHIAFGAPDRPGRFLVAVAALRLQQPKLSMRKAIRWICAALHRLMNWDDIPKSPRSDERGGGPGAPFRRSLTREGRPHEIRSGTEFRPERLSVASELCMERVPPCGVWK